MRNLALLANLLNLLFDSLKLISTGITIPFVSVIMFKAIHALVTRRLMRSPVTRVETICFFTGRLDEEITRQLGIVIKIGWI